LTIVQIDAQILYLFIYSSVHVSSISCSSSPDDEHDMLETCREL